MWRILTTWYLLTLIGCNDKPFGTYLRSIPFYFPESCLRKLPCKPVHLELTDPNAKPYHLKPYQVPHLLLPILKKEVERQCEIGVLHKTNNSQWATQGFVIPKKNKQIQFITNFCMLNQFLCRYPFRYLWLKKLCTLLMDLPSSPSSTSTWDSGWSYMTKKVNDLQQSSSPGASILTNALQWDYPSAPISIKKKCLQSFLTLKT
jgi:hypothetical protein